MDVVVLGSGASFPRPGGACSGFLVSNDGTNLWLDAGNGTLSRLLEHISLTDLDALVVTHGHPDHYADVMPLMYALALAPGSHNGALPIHAPKLIAQAPVGALLGESSAEMYERVFKMLPLPGVFDVGSLHVEPFRTNHPGETYGMRVSAGNRTLVYTSDTAIYPELPDVCRDADLLICEATYIAAHKAEPNVHMWAREAGVVAREAGVKSLLLTHVLPTFDVAQAVAEASEEYSGPIEAAVEGKRYSV
ncbi:MAG TPA: MBL fold metallo-hydrolase [Actinomycetota bacterium]|jgi:ribonuclease BN (tRNA processing enzyme)|nr:MBL fold metallo-hydrolase [Actinomycetota bacterium]